MMRSLGDTRNTFPDDGPAANNSRCLQFSSAPFVAGCEWHSCPCQYPRPHYSARQSGYGKRHRCSRHSFIRSTDTVTVRAGRFSRVADPAVSRTDTVLFLLHSTVTVAATRPQRTQCGQPESLHKVSFDAEGRDTEVVRATATQGYTGPQMLQEVPQVFAEICSVQAPW